MKKSKKSNAGLTKKSDNASREISEFQPLVLQQDTENWVLLDFRLLNWNYMNFTKLVRESTHIFTIKKLLRDRHGQMKDLKLCLNSFTEANEIHNDMLTLAQCGVRGEALDTRVTTSPDIPPSQGAKSAYPTYVIFYDFKPCEFDDPVLLYFNS